MNSYQETNNPEGMSEFRENLTIIRGIPFFSEFPLEVLKVVAYLGTRELYRKEDIIFSQDDDDARAYCILSGKALLSRTHEGNEVFIRTCGEDTFFGALTLASMHNRLYSLKAETDTCCLVITRKDFQQTIDQFPDSCKYMSKGLVESIVSWDENFLNEIINCESCRKSIGTSLI